MDTPEQKAANLELVAEQIFPGTGPVGDKLREAASDIREEVKPKPARKTYRSGHPLYRYVTNRRINERR